jgi:hypothetical protein
MFSPNLSLYILTYNCAHHPIDIDAFSTHLFQATESLPDILVISLQEISPLSHGLLGGALLGPFLWRFEEAVDIAARKLGGNASLDGRVYGLVTKRNIGMTAIMVFARDAARVVDVQTAEVGLGINHMGNKGAVGVRLRYAGPEMEGVREETELTFVAAHLAAFEWELKRRNQDWRDIVQCLVFSSDEDSKKGRGSSRGEGEDASPLLEGNGKSEEGIYKSTSHLFFAGDLNYRTSETSPGEDDAEETFPQPHHHPAAAQHYSALFAKDQLTQERLARRTCHGLIEAPLLFPPTYKYRIPKKSETDGDGDVEDAEIWDWAPHRWPSWTDRILFLDTPAWLVRKHPDAKIVTHNYEALPLMKTSDHQPVALSVSVPLLGIPEPDEEDEESLDPRIKPPFEIDPEWRTKRSVARKEELVVGATGYLTGTWEGWMIVLGSMASIVGAYFLLKAAL